MIAHEEFRILEKGNTIFEVGNYGTIRVLDQDGKVIKEKRHPGEFSFSGGHEGNRYLMTHGHYAHRLVAEAFLSEIPAGYNVNHIDGDNYNNQLTNLEIVTDKENKKHAYEMALSYNPASLNPRPEFMEKVNKEKKRIKVKRWVIYDLDFNPITDFEKTTQAAEWIGVSRQAVNTAFRRGKSIKGKYYCCRFYETDLLKERVLN